MHLDVFETHCFLRLLRPVTNVLSCVRVCCSRLCCLTCWSRERGLQTSAPSRPRTSLTCQSADTCFEAQLQSNYMSCGSTKCFRTPRMGVGTCTVSRLCSCRRRCECLRISCRTFGWQPRGARSACHHISVIRVLLRRSKAGVVSLSLLLPLACVQLFCYLPNRSSLHWAHRVAQVAGEQKG